MDLQIFLPAPLLACHDGLTGCRGRCTHIRWPNTEIPKELDFCISECRPVWYSAHYHSFHQHLLWESNVQINIENLRDYYKTIECHIKALVSAREFIDRSSEGKTLGNLGMAYAFLCGEEHDGGKGGAAAVWKQSFLEQFL